MKNEQIKEILKKCFGKNKDDRYHALAMLIIYGVFIMILVLSIRVGGNTSNVNSSLSNNSSSEVNDNIESNKKNDNDQSSNINNDNINYSYSYTITYNGISEVFLGKKVKLKEKFTHIKDGITTEYAILNGNYLILDNNNYHIINNPSNLFKYCNIEEILLLVENEIPTENNGIIKYSVSNKSLSSIFKDNLIVDNEQTNLIQLYIPNGNLKNLDLDFSNYLTSIEGTSVTLIIHIELADIGSTQDFDIKIS